MTKTYSLHQRICIDTHHILSSPLEYEGTYIHLADQYYPEGPVTQGGGRLPRDTCHSRGQWLTGLIIIRPIKFIEDPNSGFHYNNGIRYQI